MPRRVIVLVGAAAARLALRSRQLTVADTTNAVAPPVKWPASAAWSWLRELA